MKKQYRMKKVLYMGSSMLLAGLSCAVWISDIQENRQESVQKTYTDIVYNAVKNMDFTIKEPYLDITPEEEMIYKKAYLSVLKGEAPIQNRWDEPVYYKDLNGAKKEYAELLKNRFVREFPYLYYYDDLDGDGKPELGIDHGCLQILDYEPDSDLISVSYVGSSGQKFLGAGQIWDHLELDKTCYDTYIYLNSDNDWEETLTLAYSDGQYYLETALYHRFAVEKEQWVEVTGPFFEMIQKRLLQKTLDEIFGEQLGYG